MGPEEGVEGEPWRVCQGVLIKMLIKILSGRLDQDAAAACGGGQEGPRHRERLCSGSSDGNEGRALFDSGRALKKGLAVPTRTLAHSASCSCEHCRFMPLQMGAAAAWDVALALRILHAPNRTVYHLPVLLSSTVCPARPNLRLASTSRVSLFLNLVPPQCQFTRNMFRGNPCSWESDALALVWAGKMLVGKAGGSCCMPGKALPVRPGRPFRDRIRRKDRTH